MHCCSWLGSIAPCLSVPHPVPMGDDGGVLPPPSHTRPPAHGSGAHKTQILSELEGLHFNNNKRYPALGEEQCNHRTQPEEVFVTAPVPCLSDS